MQDITYGKILEIIRNNLQNAYIQSSVLKLDFENVVYYYNPRTYVVGTIEKSLVLNKLFFFFYDNSIGKFAFWNNGDCVEVPSTDDEWFNFSLTNNYTKKDYDNIKCIRDYYLNNMCYPYEKYGGYISN